MIVNFHITIIGGFFLDEYRFFLRTIKSVISVWLDTYPEDFREEPDYPCLQMLEKFAQEYMEDRDLVFRAKHKEERFRKEAQQIQGKNCFSIQICLFFYFVFLFYFLVCDFTQVIQKFCNILLTRHSPVTLDTLLSLSKWQTTLLCEMSGLPDTLLVQLDLLVFLEVWPWHSKF